MMSEEQKEVGEFGKGALCEGCPFLSTVDKIPKTADGVPVVPGMMVYKHVTDTKGNHLSMPLAVTRLTGVAWLCKETDDGLICVASRVGNVEECYSTREAAEVGKIAK